MRSDVLDRLLDAGKYLAGWRHAGSELSSLNAIDC